MNRIMSLLALLLLVIGGPLMAATVTRADENEVWDRISGNWVVDYDATAELHMLTPQQRDQIRATKAAGVKIMLIVTRGEATLRIEGDMPTTLTAEWRIVSEDSKGLFIESLTGNGARMERVSVTYLSNGSLKYEFGDMDYPLIFKLDIMEL